MKFRRFSILVALAAAAAVLIAPPVAVADEPEVPRAVVVDTDGHDHLGEEHSHEGESDREKARELAASGVTSQFFNESAGCGPSAGVATPLSTTNSTSGRSLPSGHQVRGPYGDFFGRNYSQVYAAQVWWTVPMSGGARVRVHARALPAFEQVTAHLNAEAAAGNFYQARILGSYVWRRIGGSYRMSNHAFGTAIDINWDRNPYSGSRENQLITDMPAWYVKAWTDAGFCWGGDWESIKDPMHFSWMGPSATPGYGTVPAPYPPATSRSGYGELVDRWQSAFGSLKPSWTYGFADGNRDAAPDLFRVRAWGADDIVLEFARSSRDFLSCGVTELRVRGLQSASDRYMLADFDGDARTDVWSIDESGADLVLRIATHDSGYVETVRVDTGIAVADDTEYAAADYNRDGMPDLYVMHRPRGEKIRVEVWDGASRFSSPLLEAATRLNGDKTPRLRLGVGDRDGDGIPDVYAIRVFAKTSLMILDGATGYTRGPERLTPVIAADRQGRYGLGDYDGDGRTDLFVVDRDGAVEVALGGVQGSSPDFWMRPADWECTDTVTSADPWDFNGDRASDMTVSAPGEDLSAGQDVGVVHVVDGSPSGPAAAELWYQDRLAVSPSEPGDGFGSALGWGDFDDDGYADLVVGSPAEDLGSTVDAGFINVVYGSDAGLDADLDDFENQIWHFDLSAITGTGAAGELLGAATASADFDGDGFDDLAVGTPGAAVDGTGDAGVVLVLYGSNLGLQAARHQVWSEDTAGLPGVAGLGAGFGSALAGDDFNRDGFADLAIAAPGASVGGAPNSGSVTVVYGSPGGLVAAGSQAFTQGPGSLGAERAADDRLGQALAAGDFNGDGMTDLAVGTPGDDAGEVQGSGTVGVIPGSPTGLRAGSTTWWHLDVPGLNGPATSGGALGAALAAGDFDDDGFDDLAIGAPGAGVQLRKGAGVVMVLSGGRAGLSGTGSQRWHSGKVGSPAQKDAGFGTALAVGDYDADLVDDLLVGSPYRNVTGITDAGRATLLYGRLGAGLRRAGARQWNQGAVFGGTAEAGDRFGFLGR